MSDEEHSTQDRKDDVLDVNKLPKHMRLRYWTSWEELYLVEMWRLYKSEVTTLQRNLPVFRKISDAMKDHGFYVNSQECRRKINVLKNKYSAEHRRVVADRECKFSNWRLYTQIHNVLQTEHQINNLTHENQTVNELLQNVPQEENAAKNNTSVPAATNSMDVAPIVRVCPSVEQTTAQVNLTDNTNLTNNSQTIRQRRAYTPRRPRCNVEINLHRLIQKKFTLVNVEQLRADNRRLAEQRDVALQRLHIEEKKYKLLEAYCKQWQHILQCSSHN